MKTFKTLAELTACTGQEVALSDWVTVGQSQINRFAEATGDLQWIHLDEERARAGPFGGTVAHGFLTLSLLPALMASAITVSDTRMGINYGLNKVRFPAPMPAGGRLRGRFTLLTADAIDQQGWQLTWGVVMEREGTDKPVCVAESLVRLYP